jgi:Ala-tRNA(Pro) deacylase
MARLRLFDRLSLLGIDAPTVPYPAHRTVEEGKRLRGTMKGVFTKNLLLRDKKARLFLISMHEDRNLDLGRLHRSIGATGRLSFAPAASIIELLGVNPGAVTPLGLINDATARITPVIDKALMEAGQVNFHPLSNGESTGLTPADLFRFIRSCGREPLVVDFDPIKSDA